MPHVGNIGGKRQSLAIPFAASGTPQTREPCVSAPKWIAETKKPNQPVKMVAWTYRSHGSGTAGWIRFLSMVKLLQEAIRMTAIVMRGG